MITQTPTPITEVRIDPVDAILSVEPQLTAFLSRDQIKGEVDTLIARLRTAGQFERQARRES